MAERHLLAKADAICADARSSMEQVETDFPDGGKGVFGRIHYAEAVLAASEPMAMRLAALQPPTTIREPYLEYVKSQQQIYADDLIAAHASHAVHPKEYSAAQKRRRGDEQRALEQAAEIGLEECAGR